MDSERFSRRYGYGQGDAEITIRDDAPPEVRAAVLMTAKVELGIRAELFRDVLCAVLRQFPEPSDSTDFPNVWEECQWLIETCSWYQVYDFVEALYGHLMRLGHPELAQRWQELVNDDFVEDGVGWRLVDARLETRGPEGFAVAVESARERLEQASLPTARQEIDESLADLSRRPEPDLTGAVQHAMAALECTLRETTGDEQATLGEGLKRYPGVLPKPLDGAITKMWGYASETGRHLREGRTPTRAEAELVVHVAAAVCGYLAAKMRGE